MVSFEVKGNECWVCGGQANSNHHAIPQVLEPKSNVIVPVCTGCHTKINKLDLGSISSHVYKIQKMLENKTKVVQDLRTLLEEIKNKR